jgi:hypothetical protein
MIDFQSSAIVESANHLAHRSPSPGGEGQGEGELFLRGRQSALIKVGRAYPPYFLFILSEFSVAKIRVNSRNSRKRLCVASVAESVSIHVHLWLKTNFFKTPSRFSQAYPRLGQFLPKLSKAAAGFFQAWPRWFRTFSKAIQACPRLSKVILEKKRLFISFLKGLPSSPLRWNPARQRMQVNPTKYR